MSEPRIIVIGAGLAGLSAAIYARLNGFRCTVFEQHNLPGGVCTAWNRRGYTIDGCIHWLMWTKPGSSMYEVYRELGLVDAEAFMPLTHYARFVDTLSGKSLTVDWDLNKLEAELLAISPDDAAPIHALCRAIERASRADMLIAD
ncbi:MAG: FAD-dependent oxidoreductase, partial [Myxococcota bacterium]|nr:FAD-dependent oxidoreductase [Myxococcota bacterium]